MSTVKEGGESILNTQTELNYSDIYRVCFPILVTYLQKGYVCNRQDAEDIAAEALHILWEKWDTLETHTEGGMLCWLLQTAKNLIRNETKKKTRRPETVSWDDLEEYQYPAAPPETSPHQAEEEYARYLTKITQRLSESDAALLRAKVIDRESDSEIASKLGISVTTLRVRWLRAKHRISAMWDELKNET